MMPNTSARRRISIPRSLSRRTVSRARSAVNSSRSQAAVTKCSASPVKLPSPGTQARSLPRARFTIRTTMNGSSETAEISSAILPMFPVAVSLAPGSSYAFLAASTKTSPTCSLSFTASAWNYRISLHEPIAATWIKIP